MTKKSSKKTKAPKAPNENAAAATEAPATKPKQLKLDAEGMSRKSIPEVDKAAAAYRKARDERMSHTKIEKEKKTLLMEVVKKHGITSYVFDDEDSGEEFEIEYTAETDEDVKVKKLKADDGDDE